MNLKFISNINQNGDKTEIAFEAKVVVSKYQNFDVYEFDDPKSKIRNRIEVSNKAINIFAGAASINLILKKRLAVYYQAPQGQILMYSFLEYINKSLKLIEFKYNLTSDNQIVGDYHIKLVLS